MTLKSDIEQEIEKDKEIFVLGNSYKDCKEENKRLKKEVNCLKEYIRWKFNPTEDCKMIKSDIDERKKNNGWTEKEIAEEIGYQKGFQDGIKIEKKLRDTEIIEMIDDMQKETRSKMIKQGLRKYPDNNYPISIEELIAKIKGEVSKEKKDGRI